MAEKDHPLTSTRARDVEIVPMRSLHRKLAQIMYEAERVPKNGTAPREMGGYKFVQVGDAADFIRKALAEKVLTMMPTAVHVVGQQDRPTKAGGSTTTVDLLTEWTITDGESGESITIQSFGAGADVGDKYSGKASTSAMKYALLTTFLLSTGEDSEGGSLPERARQPTTDAGRADAENTQRLQERAAVQNGTSYPAGEWSASGTAGVGKAPVDGELRQTPDGGVFGFVIEADDGKKYQVIAEHEYALPVSLVWGSMLGQRVHAAGPTELVNWGPKNARGEWQRPPYRRIHATRIEGPDFTIPALRELQDAPAAVLTEEEIRLQTETEAELDAIADSLGLVPEEAR